MKHEHFTFAQKQRDLDNLSLVLLLLANAAEAILEANTMLRRAKLNTAEINDPDLRRQALAAAGELKATTGRFFDGV